MNDKNVLIEKYKLNFKIAFEAVLSNKARTILTSLGIIFGVAAVISMLAIGNGAKKELLEQMKLVGVNNIIITPKLKKEQNAESKKEDKKDNNQADLSPGLTVLDAEAIKRLVPTVKCVSPEVTNEHRIIFRKNGITAKLTGINENFFEVYNLDLSEGKLFNESQFARGDQVCVIGHNVAVKLFPTEPPIGKEIKCGSVWLKIIGTLKSRFVEEEKMSNLKIENFNMNVYTPIQTILLRSNDRSRISSKSLESGDEDEENGSSEMINRNQLDKLVIQIDKSENLANSLNVIARVLKRRHAGMEDYTVTVPELLLKQEQKTRSIFNIVLAAIASISLIVGGIGIMNIMLASVLERIKEIGLRRAIGATEEDIVVQFIAEAAIISLSGGILGIILGVVLAKLISQFTDILTIVSAFSVIISFFVSVGVGIIFGFMPAKKAAQQDPVTSLRHE